MAIYSGRWDCVSCGFIGNHGPNKHCINCGATRPPDVRFYLPADSEKLTEEEAIKEALMGPDWICTYCESHNIAISKFCSECGSQHSAINLEEKTYKEKDVPVDSGKKTQEDHVEEYKEEHGLKKKAKRFFSWAKATVLAVLTAIIAFLSSFSSTVNVDIVALNWDRSVTIEEFRLTEDEGWEIPSGGKLIKSFQAIHHTERVSKGFENKTRTKQVQVGTETYVCGKKDMGNGYFEDIYCDRPIYENQEETYREEVFEEVPVYRTKYRYAVKRWEPDGKLTDKGIDRPAKWPTSPKLENTARYRISDRSERYAIVVERNSKRHIKEIDFAYWDKQRVGGTVKAEISTVFRYFKGIVR